jgi:photosystem II stability/assembly factor-like uncharacterized protein
VFFLMKTDKYKNQYQQTIILANGLDFILPLFLNLKNNSFLMLKSLYHLLIFCLFSAMLSAQKINADYLQKMPIRSIGPGAMSGRITAITCDPTNVNILYAGAASGGVWRSKSGGATWEPIFDKAPTQGIGSLAINPKNPDEIWVGTGEGNPRNSQNFGIGIFKSIDGGKNWICMGLEKTRSIHRIIIHRDNPNIVWAAVMGSPYGGTQERGVYKTEDGGKTWRKTLFVNDLTGCADLVVDPSNPNKIIAAMWEYRRWPWFFKSGGKGSGLYISYDGGENWERRNDKDGLPEGELGRMGLAISTSNPQVVYALVEAKENALYKSTDGGKKWKAMASKGQGDRPFYYSEIYVDPKDENTIYSVFTTLSRSIDGGKSFESFAGWIIHPDHHAFWINPNDSKHIIDGNDGGLNITQDGGKSWRFAENIPIGQFYHVNVDNEKPYKIYGGLQDNGTWVGPSSVWKSGGIRNSDWKEIMFGDGFDAMGEPENARFAYAMSQGGELYYVDILTGDNRYIKPLHPESKKLRFNWNAALAQDPFESKSIYFASQYVHYSQNNGQKWEIISPDLTTNDTSKMHQDNSGGLTLDATNAENHCTILTIAPSPVQKGLIWVGTDDGNIQLTTDAGKNWKNCAINIPNLPKNAWIPQIEVSPVNAGEAFVVVNNYRQNDWEPYLFHTTDFGNTWKNIVDSRQVTGFSLCVVQDKETPNLLFLGTDQGLYFSIDKGKNWNKWSADAFPSCPVQDMKIHPRDGDLVIGTFGRAIWILDDIRPLRELSRSNAAVLKSDFKVFNAPEAILASYGSYDGVRFNASSIYEGQNKSTDARVAVWINPETIAAEKIKAKTKKEAEEKAKKDKKSDSKDKKTEEKDKKDLDKKGGGDKITVTVKSMQGDTLRRFKTTVDTCINYIEWNLDTKGARMPSNNEPDKDQLEPWGGPTVAPGTYKIVAQYGDFKDSTLITVVEDHRLNYTLAEREAKAVAIRDLNKSIEKAEKAYNRLKDAEKIMKLIDDQFQNVPDSTKKQVTDLAKPIRDSIGILKSLFFSQKEIKGIQRNPDFLNSRFWKARGYISEGRATPNSDAKLAFEEVNAELTKINDHINLLFDKPWKDYKVAVEAVKYSLFKDFERL